MCGGIVAIYSARQAAQASSDGIQLTTLSRILQLLPVHLGRIITYTFFGALIGLAGSLLNQAGGMLGWQGMLSVLVGVAMLLVSLSLLGVLPKYPEAAFNLKGKIEDVITAGEKMLADALANA